MGLISSIVYAVLLIGIVPVILFLKSLVQYIWKKKKIADQLRKIPGPKGSFFMGNMTQLFKLSGEERLTKWTLENCKKYKTCYRYRIGPVSLNLQVCHPSTIKAVMKTAEPKMHSDKRGYNFLLHWLGKGLLINDGPGWFRNRRLLTPAFHFETLKPYVTVYNEATDVLLNKFAKNVDNLSDKNGSVEIYEAVSLCTLNVMLRCAFSFTENVQEMGNENKYVKTVGDLAGLIYKRVRNPLMWFDTIYHRTTNGKKWLAACEYAHNVAYDLIRKRKAELDKQENASNRKAMDFLDILLLARDENNQGLSELEMRVEVDTFLFEGHDTTASAISWCMHLLASHPEYQTKAREEVDALFDERGSDSVEWDDYGKIPYLTMCIKESLRHTPAVPFIGRELENPLEVDGVMLEPGTQIAMNIWGVHHNPHVWGDDHMEYKPERFEHENIKHMDPHAFVPFAAGPRNCIGQNFAMNEIKTVMMKMLRRFIMDDDPDKVPKRTPLLVMRSENGIHLRLTPRN